MSDVQGCYSGPFAVLSAPFDPARPHEVRVYLRFAEAFDEFVRRRGGTCRRVTVVDGGGEVILCGAGAARPQLNN